MTKNQEQSGENGVLKILGIGIGQVGEWDLSLLCSRTIGIELLRIEEWRATKVSNYSLSRAKKDGTKTRLPRRDFTRNLHVLQARTGDRVIHFN